MGAAAALPSLAHKRPSARCASAWQRPPFGLSDAALGWHEQLRRQAGLAA